MAISGGRIAGSGPRPIAMPSRWWKDALIYVGSAVLCLVILPNVYAEIVVATSSLPAVPLPALNHILANCFANLLVVVAAFSGEGRFDQKLAYVANSTLRAHGLLALVVVLTHSSYSNWVMISAIAVSCVIGTGAAVLKHRIERVRVGMVGEAEVLARQTLFQGERVSDPDADLSRYAVLLTPYDGEMPSAWAQAVTRAMLRGKRVRHAAEYLEETRGMVSLEHFDLDMLPPPGPSTYKTMKRAIDVVIAAMALVVALPIIAIAALAILATMGRPVFFTQTRVGLGGAPFRINKLRTMKVSADDGVAATTAHDDRVTPLGRWLRKLRIDELPQLVNVLAGHMSLIGPRPEWDLLAARYSDEIPAYAYRHLVRPGITGWAQVRAGYASDVSETRLKLAYDLFYLKYFSPALDLQILLRTAFTVLSGSGAR